MKKYLSALTFALTMSGALLAIAVPQAQAQAQTQTPTTTTPAAKKAATKKKTAKAGAHAKSKKTAAKKKTGAKAVVHSKTQHAHAEAHHVVGKAAVPHSSTYAKAAPAVGKMPFSSDADDDDKEPDLGGTKSAELFCEMGNRLTLYKNDADDKHIAIRWNKHISRLTRVPTTTGANRFENHKIGLVWIGIPAKGILLDSKKGQQLANECKTTEQATASAPVPATPNS